MLAAIALFHFSFPGFLPGDPLNHLRVLPTVRQIKCQLCVVRPGM
jgi:hypothetical protein